MSNKCTDVVPSKKYGMVTKEDKVNLKEWHAASSVCNEYEQKEYQTNMIDYSIRISALRILDVFIHNV